jgi:hypothetical protein
MGPCKDVKVVAELFGLFDRTGSAPKKPQMSRNPRVHKISAVGCQLEWPPKQRLEGRV